MRLISLILSRFRDLSYATHPWPALKFPALCRSPQIVLGPFLFAQSDVVNAVMLLMTFNLSLDRWRDLHSKFAATRSEYAIFSRHKYTPHNQINDRANLL